METAEQSDAQLVAGCRAGDPAAWNAFVERFSRYVYAICSRGFRLGREDAEDVFQEVFARAYEKLAELRSDDAVLPLVERGGIGDVGEDLVLGALDLDAGDDRGHVLRTSV